MNYTAIQPIIIDLQIVSWPEAEVGRMTMTDSRVIVGLISFEMVAAMIGGGPSMPSIQCESL